MKYTDLTAKQKELLNAFIQGEPIQLNHCYYGWSDVDSPLEAIDCYDDNNLRIKPKEPVIKHTFAPVFIDGVGSHLTCDSIEDILAICNDAQIHSFIMKTYHDGVFIEVEVIPKQELILSLKGLV